MESIKSNSYKIVFGTNGYKSLKEVLIRSNYSKIFVLTDNNTDEYCKTVFLKNIGGNFMFNFITIHSGEAHKNIHTCLHVWEQLSELHADRKSLLIGLGGGVVTDLGGFVASTYMRGIDYINIPTTLLSMVDASVGGKTGVDLGMLKNLVGVFALPKMILVDMEYLNTLPQTEIVSGFAEMIKHTLITGKRSWEAIQKIDLLNSDLSEEIYNSIVIKTNVVLQDMKEQNLRKTLNFGHTLGHAIETFFLKSIPEKHLLHGNAIAIGMVLVGFLSTIYTNFSLKDSNTIKIYIRKIYPLVLFKKDDIEQIIKLTESDKKNSHGNINFVLLKDIGQPVIDIRVNDSDILKAFEYYMS